VHGGGRRLSEFVRGVDLLIQDAQYTPEEYDEHRGWGHGSTAYVTDVAVQAAARRVALFHHEPTHADADIDRMVEYSRRRAGDVGSQVEIFGAAEGKELVLEGQASRRR
jgi:ribonuclease BN (tRNA processing enzyme)